MSVQRDNAACLESLEHFLESAMHTPIVEGLLSIREQADEITQQSVATEMDANVITKQLLREVKTWTQVLLDEEVRRIVAKIPYLQKLLTALFVMKVKVLSCINMRKDNGEFPLTIPANSTFIHQAYINCANVLLDNSHVLDDMKMVDLRPLISEGIRKACFACIEWSDLLEWGLEGVDVNEIIRAVTDDQEQQEGDDVTDDKENTNNEDKDWPDDSNQEEEFHDLANDVKMNDDNNEDVDNSDGEKENHEDDNENDSENAMDTNSVSESASVDDKPDSPEEDESKTVNARPSFF